MDVITEDGQLETRMVKYDDENKCPNCGATEGIDMRSKMPNTLYWVCTNCLWGWHVNRKEKT